MEDVIKNFSALRAVDYDATDTSYPPVPPPVHTPTMAASSNQARLYAIAESCSESEQSDDTTRSSGRFNVLVAEDNFANQLVAKTLLMRAGHKVITANDGQEAISLCQSTKFDLILMDIEMPGLNGIEATEHIRQTSGPNQHTQIIALTAYGSASDKYIYRHSGIDHVITKPFKISALSQFLSKDDHVKTGKTPALVLPVQMHDANAAPDNVQDTNLSTLTELPYLDIITIDVLLAGAGKENVRKIVKAYWRSAYGLLSDMQSAHQVWDRDRLQKAAHALKGASINIGLLQAGQIAAQLQNTLPDVTTQYLEALDYSMARSRKALSQHISSG